MGKELFFLSSLGVQIWRVSNDNSKFKIKVLAPGLTLSLPGQLALFRCSMRFFCAYLKWPSLQCWVIRSQLWVHLDSAKFCPDSKKEMRIRKGLQNQDPFIHAWNPKVFSPYLAKNSNWVKYRKLTVSPFYLLLPICVQASSVTTARTGLALELWSVGYWMWGSSWESKRTCHSWAPLRHGPPLGFSPFAKWETTLGAAYRTPRRDDCPNLL